ncbi:hypothetical protein Psi02_10870 [Planotetraspora silvatica]|uniref:DUF4434 domain-containing protein n=1 Tax=Planotetraspora silvatica TaxID=234614 RepID=A0A8J3UG42_9ACTN|nr:DUF4434 domain-containing protein [Planotetraspora silvatica]GII44663.1 hypothetical protein Psi02_10870 [Planotetraspora silvatica]
MRVLTLILGVTVLLVVTTVVIVLRHDPREPPIAKVSPTVRTVKPSPSPSADPCGTPKTSDPTPYPVTGFWVVPSDDPDPCTWRHQFEGVHQAGGDTVVRFGFEFTPRQVDDSGRILTAPDYLHPKKVPVPDDAYAKCAEDGLTCAQAAQKDLKAANPGNQINSTFVYATDERFGSHVFRCPSMEHQIVVGNSVFYRLLLPADGTDDAACDFSKGRDYDLILVKGAARDSLSDLLDLGDRFDIKVFPALPIAPRDLDTYQADTRYIGPLSGLTRRVLQDYGYRFKNRKSLGGFYQSYELGIRDWPDPSTVGTLQVYRAQHRVVDETLPGKPVLVSPYVDARRKVAFSSTPTEVGEGFRILARNGVDIIAPQDGRGSGKMALFWPNWTNRPVDKRLEPVVGKTTYAKAYYAGTRSYFQAMSKARDELAQDGVNVQLWANLEAFQPTAAGRCGDQGSRGSIDKPRMDAQVTLAGPYVSKIISYMWSGFYTCGSPSLSEQIAKDWKRPIPIGVKRQKRQIQDGMEITGYRLGDARVGIAWGKLEHPRQVDSAKVGWHDTTPIEGLPRGAEKIWIPVDWATIPKNTWVRVDVSAPDGRKAAEPVYYYNGV